ncbi:MAG TPA: hypothetical protein DCG53_13115 [Syntrophus sp. (in: bacteria)]|nr:hypothetical protein [Syntrophus sp. (in: bacteria)]
MRKAAPVAALFFLGAWMNYIAPAFSPYFADLLFLLGTGILLWNFLTWEQIKEHKLKRLIQILTIIFAISIASVSIWANHNLIIQASTTPKKPEKKSDSQVPGVTIPEIKPQPPTEKHKTEKRKSQEPPKFIPQERPIPFVDIALIPGNGYAFDSYVINKSDVILSNISVSRTVDHQKNKKRRGLHGYFESALKPHVQKTFNVLDRKEEGNIERVLSYSMEYMIFTVTYWEDLNTQRIQYRCVFEGEEKKIIMTDECHSIFDTNASKHP